MNTLKHGTTVGYKNGCRCQDCKDAKSADYRAYRARKEAEAEMRGVDSNINHLIFRGLPPEEVELMSDLAFHYVMAGVPVPEAGAKARAEVLGLDRPSPA